MNTHPFFQTSLIKYRALLSGIGIAALSLALPMMAHAATLDLSTSKETFVIGDTFTVDIKLRSADVGVNAAQATLSYPRDILQVTSLDRSTSVFSFWLQGPEYSNDTGKVSFIGGAQNGVSGQDLEILRIAFKVKGAGAVRLVFSDGAVTASDGSGTNVLSAMNGLELTSITKQDAALIKPPQIVRPAVPSGALPAKPKVSVPLYPDPTGWYAHNSKFLAQWDLPNDVTAVATAVNRQPSFNPTESEGLFDNQTFAPLDDGIWYLHVRFRNALGWGTAAHYRIGIDTAPPINLLVESLDGLKTEDVAPAITFSAKDQPSGIALFKIFVDGELATTSTAVEHHYVLPQQTFGTKKVLVQAVDNAGNTTEARLSIEILAPPVLVIGGFRVTQFWLFMVLVVALAGGILFGRYLDRLGIKRRRRQVVIAARDITAVSGLVQKDITTILEKCEEDTLHKKDLEEVKSLLLHIRGTAEKFGKYAVENIEEIE